MSGGDRVIFEAWSVADAKTGEIWRPGPRQVAITGQTEARAWARHKTEATNGKRTFRAIRVRVEFEEIPDAVGGESEVFQ